MMEGHLSIMGVPEVLAQLRARRTRSSTVFLTTGFPFTCKIDSASPDTVALAHLRTKDGKIVQWTTSDYH
jgi:hypothetical protein